jgi:hypothetical protein
LCLLLRGGDVLLELVRRYGGTPLVARRLLLGHAQVGKGARSSRAATTCAPLIVASLLPLAPFLHLDQDLAGPALGALALSMRWDGDVARPAA